jgi:hypothetical protein
MFRRILTPACFALLVLTAGLANANTAAAGQWASFVIKNTSSVPINYTVEWSDGEVEVVTIAPGDQLFHGVRLNAWGLIPTPYIMFDNVAGDGQYSETRYELDAYVVDNPAIGGKGYSFIFASGGVALNLFAD